MISPTAIAQPVPSPTDLFGAVASPWQVEGDQFWQPTMDHTIAKEPLTPAEKLVAVLQCPLLLPVASGPAEHELSDGSRYPVALMLALVAGSACYPAENAMFRDLEPQRRNITPLWPL